MLLCDCTPTGVPEELRKYCEDVRFCRTKGSQKKNGTLFRSLFSGFPFSALVRTSVETKKAIGDSLTSNQIDLIICDAIYRAMNIPFEAPVPKMLYEHNIESVIVKRYLNGEMHPLKRFIAGQEFRKLLRFEERMWKKFNVVIACSKTERRIIEERINHRNVIVADNGVNTAYFDPDSFPHERNALVYTGQIGWHPNEDALVYFTNEIFPLIKKGVPNVTFTIVGEKPSRRIKELAAKDSSIQITGFVEDVRPYMGTAAVFVVPLRIGSGTRLKILEAMSMKKAIVSTSIGCEGLEVEDGKHLLVRDDPNQFAEAVVGLLQDDTRRHELGEQGRRLVEQRYDWSKVFGGLDVVFAKIDK